MPKLHGHEYLMIVDFAANNEAHDIDWQFAEVEFAPALNVQGRRQDERHDGHGRRSCGRASNKGNRPYSHRSEQHAALRREAAAPFDEDEDQNNEVVQVQEWIPEVHLTPLTTLTFICLRASGKTNSFRDICERYFRHHIKHFVLFHRRLTLTPGLTRSSTGSSSFPGRLR